MTTYRITKGHRKSTGEKVIILHDISTNERFMVCYPRDYADYADECKEGNNECAEMLFKFKTQDGQTCVVWQDWEAMEYFISPSRYGETLQTRGI